MFRLNVLLEFIFYTYRKKIYMKSYHLNIYYKINKIQRNCKESWVYFIVRTNTACFKEPLKNS